MGLFTLYQLLLAMIRHYVLVKLVTPQGVSLVRQSDQCHVGLKACRTIDAAPLYPTLKCLYYHAMKLNSV
jgi:hypothetical protein